MLVQIVLFDGFDLLDALAPYEVFCAAEMYSGGAIRVELVTAEGARSVSSGLNGLQITASGGIDLERAGIILVPGASGEVSGDGPNSVPAILSRASETKLTPLMGEALGKPELTVATVCGGSLLLAMGGLLDGRHAVTNHLGMDVLGATGAIPVRARVVDDGNLVTGGGVTSGLDVALYLVERELGPRIASEVEKLFEYERGGTVWQQRGMIPIIEKSSSGSAEETLLQVRPDELAEARATDIVFEGAWHVVITTPIGKQHVALNISSENGHVRGIAVQGDEVVEFVDPVIQNNRLIWSQRVTKPMRLNLKFEVTVHGNEMTGIAKAGMLPASKLIGERVANQA
ncbi:DJ-1/PfpI family protein [Paenibacillus sedimenti]|uniref:DJ-1/PfpI family protein n=1 Tax=Paenibacillus sedimenti TaxID=2770274 RepID=A0A926KRH9_9BACL|nr:DJ-1/PfpI family protein [Paenibacillus sedimenti]MBD0381978.1 DJ-1/PfpI family protein [Paenibacillus sedimenti]